MKRSTLKKYHSADGLAWLMKNWLRKQRPQGKAIQLKLKLRDHRMEGR